MFRKKHKNKRKKAYISVENILTLGDKTRSKKRRQPGKCIPCVMHDAAKVVYLSQ